MGNLVDSCFRERDRCSYICSRSQSAARSKRSVDWIVSHTALLPIGGVIRLRFAGLPCAISTKRPFPCTSKACRAQPELHQKFCLQNAKISSVGTNSNILRQKVQTPES